MMMIIFLFTPLAYANYCFTAQDESLQQILNTVDQTNAQQITETIIIDDILTRVLERESSPLERFQGGVILDQLPPGIRPLPTATAIAEICQEADICARLDSPDPMPEECQDAEQFGIEADPESCTGYYNREFYGCNESIPPLPVSALISIIRTNELTRQMYSVYILSKIKEYFINTINHPDLNFDTPDDQSFAIFQTWQGQHPEEAEYLSSISQNSLPLAVYTADCYGKINRLFWERDPRKILRYYHLLSSLENTLSLFPIYNQATNRGVSLPGAVLEEHQIGAVVRYSAFTSTAEHIEQDRSDHPRNTFLSDVCQQLYIAAPSNPSLGGYSIANGSLAESEREVLYPPGSCFRIDNRTQRPIAPEYCENGGQIIEMTPVACP